MHHPPFTRVAHTKMRLFPLDLQCLMTAALLVSFTKALPRSRSPSARNLTIANDLVHLVDPRRHPDWSGPFNPQDCKQAAEKMKMSVWHYDPLELIIFWSRRWSSKPSAKVTFGLPWISVSGKTCPPSTHPLLNTSNVSRTSCVKERKREVRR